MSHENAVFCENAVCKEKATKARRRALTQGCLGIGRAWHTNCCEVKWEKQTWFLVAAQENSADRQEVFVEGASCSGLCRVASRKRAQSFKTMQRSLFRVAGVSKLLRGEEKGERGARRTVGGSPSECLVLLSSGVLVSRIIWCTASPIVTVTFLFQVRSP